MKKSIRVNLVSLQFQPNPDLYREWLDYHHALGFDKIFVFDNNRTKFDHETQPLPAVYDNVKVIPIFDLGHNTHGEQSCRTKYAEEYLKDCDYLLVLDADEFLYIKENISVKKFLKKYENIPFEQLGIPWKGMASNKAIQSGKSAIEDFRYTSMSGIPNNLYNDKREPCAIKSFFLKESVVENGNRDLMHYLGWDLGGRGLYSCNGEKITTAYYDHYKYGTKGFDEAPAYICHYRWTYLDDIRKYSKRYKASKFYGGHTTNPNLQKDRVVDKIPPEKLGSMYEARMREYTIKDDSMLIRKQELLANPFPVGETVEMEVFSPSESKKKEKTPEKKIKWEDDWED